MPEPDSKPLPEPITVSGQAAPADSTGTIGADASAAQPPAAITIATGEPARGTVNTIGVDLLAESARAPNVTAVTLAPGPQAPPRKVPPEFLGYRIERELGVGGMGLVYQAVHERLKRTVALKLLKPDVSGRKEFAERFLRESKAMAAVSHENVVGIFDAGEHDGFFYMALEYVPGGDLSRLLRRRGPLPSKDAIAILLGCARGLGAIHDAGLIHRDIKPQNIFLDRELHPKIGDLGLARAADGADRMTMTGAAWGTPAYMSPEQVRGLGDIDVRSDVYSLGATLFTALTGTEPFDGATSYIITHKVLTDPPPDPRAHNHQVPPALAAITIKAMAKERAERYANVLALTQDLERARDGRPLLYATVPNAPPQGQHAPAGMAAEAAASRASGGGSLPTLSPGMMKTLALLLVAGILYAVLHSMQGQVQVDQTATAAPGAASGFPSWAKDVGRSDNCRWADLVLGDQRLRFTWCPPSSFMMGSPADEPGREVSETRHRVTLTRGFWIASTECTRGLWREAMGAATVEGDAQVPQAEIDRDDCSEFFTALVKRLPGATARLPTEAEWEYACRAGSDTPLSLSSSIEDQGWSAGGQLLDAWRAHAGEPGADLAVTQAVVDLRNDPAMSARPVAGLRPNPWNLYDMHGNLAEWCADDWDGQSPLPGADETDPVGENGGLAVCRGGSWWVPAERCRSAARAAVKPSTRAPWLGLRIVIVDAPAPPGTK